MAIITDEGKKLNREMFYNSTLKAFPLQVWHWQREKKKYILIHNLVVSSKRHDTVQGFSGSGSACVLLKMWGPKVGASSITECAHCKRVGNTNCC